MGSASNNVSEDVLPHHTSTLEFRFYPRTPVYVLRPGHPKPGWHYTLLRRSSFQRPSGGTGILTCFPSTTPLGLALGPD